ncbi:unnamed protein product [Moneuplotes crassus]|uniref:Uncharacterized protein n=1 Tax=Euplotes crassus TaxID=5936 RepID=A0AAD1XSU6_EUPCR|nr:unnamed protein product [Moneuplotes crassus]
MKFIEDRANLVQIRRAKELEVMEEELGVDDAVVGSGLTRVYGDSLLGMCNGLELNLSNKVDQLCLKMLNNFSGQKSLGIYAQISINTTKSVSQCKKWLNSMNFLKIESLTLAHTERATGHLDFRRIKNCFLSRLQNVVHEINLIHFSLPKEVITSVLSKGSHLEDINFNDCTIDLEGVRIKSQVKSRTRYLDFTGSTFMRGFRKGKDFSDFFERICILLKQSYLNSPLRYVICQKWAITEKSFKFLISQYKLEKFEFLLARNRC